MSSDTGSLSSSTKTTKSTNINRYDNLLYDSGWFRELFLELIIDDCEKIDLMINPSPYIIGDNPLSVKSINVSSSLSINTMISSRIEKMLKLSRPQYVLQDFIDHILEYQHYKRKQNQSNKQDPVIGIDDLSLDQLMNMGISIEKLITIFYNKQPINEKVKYIENLFLEHLVQCDENIVQDDSLYLLNNKSWYMYDPVEVILDEPKYIHIFNNHISIKNLIYIENTRIIKQNSLNIRLKYVGAIRVYIENNVYHGKWLKSNKKKKIKYFPNWLPSCHFVEPSGNINYSTFSYGSLGNSGNLGNHGNHGNSGNSGNSGTSCINEKIIMCTNLPDFNKIFKIRSNYYVLYPGRVLRKIK